MWVAMNFRPRRRVTPAKRRKRRGDEKTPVKNRTPGFVALLALLPMVAPVSAADDSKAQPGAAQAGTGAKHIGRERGREDQGGRTGSGARVTPTAAQYNQHSTKREEFSMKVSSVMSLVAATLFAVGIVGPVAAQTSTPAPAAPKSDTPTEKTDKTEKKDSGKAHKQHATKKKPAAKKSDDTKAADTKAPEQPKK